MAFGNAIRALGGGMGMKRPAQPMQPPPSQIGGGLGPMMKQNQGIGPSPNVMQNMGMMGGMMGRSMQRPVQPPIDTGIQVPPVDAPDVMPNQGVEAPIPSPPQMNQGMMGGLAPRMGAIQGMMRPRPVPRRY